MHSTVENKCSLKQLLNLSLALLLLLLLSSCGGHSAVGRTENFIYAWPSIGYTSDKDIAIGVIDQRPYVVNGDNEPTYIGLMRGGFNNPWYMNTASGEPLADDLSKAIVSGYNNAGISAKSVYLKFNMSHQDIERDFTSKKGIKKILLKINEWQSDTFRTIAFSYSLAAEVYNEDGLLVAKQTEQNINEDWDNKMVEDTINAGRSVIEKILNNSSIIEALQ